MLAFWSDITGERARLAYSSTHQRTTNAVGSILASTPLPHRRDLRYTECLQPVQSLGARIVETKKFTRGHRQPKRDLGAGHQPRAPADGLDTPMTTSRRADGLHPRKFPSTVDAVCRLPLPLSMPNGAWPSNGDCLCSLYSIVLYIVLYCIVL